MDFALLFLLLGLRRHHLAFGLSNIVFSSHPAHPPSTHPTMTSAPFSTCIWHSSRRCHPYHRRRSLFPLSPPNSYKKPTRQQTRHLQALVTHSFILVHSLPTASIFIQQPSLILGLPPNRHGPTLLTPSNCVPFDSLLCPGLVLISSLALDVEGSLPSVLPTVVRYLVLC